MEAMAAGIDVGTSGVRALACDAAGKVWAEATQPLRSTRGEGLFEQDPEDWWRSAVACLRAVTAEVQGHGRIGAISVAATSGTVCLLDSDGHAIRPALMYADARAGAEAAQIDAVARDLDARLGYRFNSSWGLPKFLWLLHHEPEHVSRARYLAHAGDAITGRLCGAFGVTDATQALKSGYDLLRWEWPPFIEGALGLPVTRLPRVVTPGTVAGVVSRAAAAESGLPAGATVVAGMTDGCASQIAAGATTPGQWLSVIGTTLVVKGVSRVLLHDPAGRIYSHRHPCGFWLPGAASNTGGEALGRWPRDALARYDRAAARLSPTGVAIYPLEGRGERFPFVRPAAAGFVQGILRSDEERYAATLEGVAYVERLGYEVLQGLGASVSPVVLTAGGGARSETWLQIRADVLQRILAVPRATGAAFGAAILAASAGLHPDLETATRAMARVERQIEPRRTYATAYDGGYRCFLNACRERGYTCP